MPLVLDFNTSGDLVILVGATASPIDSMPQRKYELILDQNPELAVKQLQRILIQQHAAKAEADRRIGTVHAPTQQMIEHLTSDPRWTKAGAKPQAVSKASLQITKCPPKGKAKPRPQAKRALYAQTMPIDLDAFDL